MKMKLPSAALFLMNLHAIKAGKETIDLNGSTDGSCLNQVYQQTHPNTTLQCLSTHRFWSKISAESNSQCVEGRTLSIKNLSFQSMIDWEAYDFGLYVSTSETFAEVDNVQTMNPYLMPLYGDSCEVKTLDRENGVDADGDSCYDVLPFGSGSSNAGDSVSVITVPELVIPCSSYDGTKGTVKLQFCASWRGYEENADCDVNGISPCSFEGCSCEVVDLGVQIVGPEDAKPTCEPTAVNGTAAPTVIEAPTAPNGKPVVVSTPVPSPSPSLIGIDTDMPSPAPFVITVTSSPISMDTPSPTVSTNGSDDVTSEDEVDTCKNNAVITSLDTSGSIQITTQAAHGACAILSDSSIIYYPIPNYLGGDSCGYSVCLDSETSGELTCTEGSLNVSVVECPIWGLGTQSPVANEDAPTMSPTCDYATIDASNNQVDTPVNTPVDIQVLENDLALDGLPLDVVAILFPGNNGVCNITNDGNTITYTPNTDFFGSDKCIYTACDEEEHCDSATVIINVIPSSEKVVTIDDEISTNITTPIDIFALENDIQVDGHDLIITKIVSNGESGDCVVVNQGTVVMYIPEPDFIGADTCVYEACDDREVCDEANITITVYGSHCDDKEDLTESPTPSPITSKPTAPTFAWVPTTSKPTPEPSTSPSAKPSNKPVTDSPTKAPITPVPTPLPTKAPITSSPSNAPTTSPITPVPTPLPTKAPITSSPSNKPVTDSPTKAPITPVPTQKPVLTWTFATRKPVTAKPTPYPVEPVTPAPTPCDTQIFFLYNNVCTNEVFIAGQFSYDSAVSCCNINFGEGSYMTGECVYKDACSTPVPSSAPVEDTTDSPNCGPDPLSPIDISGKRPTQEPTEMPVTPEPTLYPVTTAPTACEERSFFYYDNTCTNMVYSADATSYSSATECCDANVALGSLANGRCEYVDMCNDSTEQPTPSPSKLDFPKDTLPPTSISIPEDTPFPTAGIPIDPDGSSKTIPPTPSPSMFSIVKTYTPTPAPSEFASTPEPTFGSTPTVGTSTTLSPVRERGD